MNPFKILGVNRSATESEIRSAYKRKAQQNHPDKGGDLETMKLIQKSFAILTDPTRCQLYKEYEYTGDPKDYTSSIKSQLGGLLAVALENNEPEKTDLIGQIQEAIRNVMIDNKQSIFTQKKKLDKYRKNGKRFVAKNKDGADLIAGLIEKECNAMQSQIDNTITKMLESRAIMEFLNDYEYITDEPGSVMDHCPRIGSSYQQGI